MRRIVVRAVVVAAALLAVGATPALANPFTFSPLVTVSPGGSPFGATSSGAACQNAQGTQAGTDYPGTQVEPWLSVDPSNNEDMIAVWQQDRWSSGGANALLSAYSTDGGKTWTTPPITAQPKFTYCTGGSGDSGGYIRASDPWVTHAPNGDAYFMALQADIGVTYSNNNAMSVSKSADHGATWSDPVVLKRDTSFNVLNDKNTITADPHDSNYVYAIWDRLEFPSAKAAREAGENAIGYRGPTWFARTTDGGGTWEPARQIYDPGEVNQTIGNQIVVLGDGTLVDGFDLIYNFKNSGGVRGYNVAAMTSSDRGASWSQPKILANFSPGTVTDPTTGAAVRTGDIIPEIAADPRTTGDASHTAYMVWQARSADSRAAVYFSKSTDSGRTWSDPRVINTHPTVEAFTPTIRVGQDGTVTVTYYDFRNDTSSAPLWTDTWSIHSHDGGETWTEDHVSGKYDMSTAAIARGYFVGDYEGLGAGIDPADSTQFFEPGFVEADGSRSRASSHVKSTTGK